MDSVIKDLCNPLIEAFTSPDCRSRDFTVKSRRDAEIKSAGIRFVGFNAPFLAIFKVFFNNSVKALNRLGNGIAVKSNNITGVHYPADEDAVFEVRFNLGYVIFVSHRVHGFFLCLLFIKEWYRRTVPLSRKTRTIAVQLRLFLAYRVNFP
jgi:hypothetical protein